MRTLVRIFAFLLAVPLLIGGLGGLALTQAPEENREGIREGLVALVRTVKKDDSKTRGRTDWRRKRSKRKGSQAEQLVEQLESRAAHLPLLAIGLLLGAYALWPRGSREVSQSSQSSRAGASERDSRARTEPARRSKKEIKRILRTASSIEQGQGAEAAGEYLAGEDLRDESVQIFLRAGLIDRAAEVRHDQNRFQEAAELYSRAERWEAAAGIYCRIEQFQDAARCYLSAEKRSIAGEMFERAQNFREAGRCYRDIGFHRHAAQAFLKAGCKAEAAQSLVSAFEEEGGATSGPEQKQKELRGIAKKAGELFSELERFDEAESILVRASAYSQAAKVAFRVGAFDRAADLCLRIGRGDLAAKALEQLGDSKGAARVLGEYLRDKGEDEDAVVQLEKAEDWGSAGDLNRKLERFNEAGGCYSKAGDFEAAAEMFRIAGNLERAGEAFEKSGNFALAAGCFGEAGDPVRQASLMEKAGNLFTAGRIFSENEQADEAIRVLQLIPSDAPDFAEACSVLGRLFAEKGMDTLSIKKFEDATQEAPVSRENVAAYYELARMQAGRGDNERAVEILEKVVSFDFHYSDATSTLDRLKSGTSGLSRSARVSSERYELVREIGRGGMGVVYLARDTVLEREVAYKVLPEQLRDNQSALKNFLREAKSAAQLNHPNIVTVFDAGESEHGYYFAMELVDGMTLKEIVQRRGPVAPGGVIYILRQIADALGYAHSKRVVHRDIKTANTMWTSEKQVKIMDFGLAKLMEEVRNATTVVSGTPFYMSPEQTLGKNVDHRTDIYSLGVTLFELATGQLPFRRGNVPYHHVHTAPPDPRSVNENVSDGLAKIILRCLEKSPDARYGGAKEIIVDLDRLSPGSTQG